MRSEVNMDKVILKANFIKPTKADEEFLKKEIFSKNFDQLNVQDAIKAFDALASRLTADKWPQRRDAGHLMLISLCNRLSSCISKINQKEMVDKVTPHVLKACESCIVAGLPASLIDIMKKLVEMIPSEFYKDMPQDRFRMVLGLVHAGRYRSFPNDEQADYAKLNCFEPINNVICSIEKETFRKHFDDLLKTVDYVIREMLTGGESDAIYFDHILYCIRQQCGDHPLLMLKTDCNKLIELIGAYQKLLEQNEVGSEKTQKMVGAVFGVLFTLMRGEILTVGAALGPFIISLLPRVRRLEERRPWLRGVVHDLVSALRIGDKEQALVFKDVPLESVLPHVRPLLAEVRREPKEWREEVEDIFRLGLMSFCRTDADCQLMFGVFGDYLAWRSGKMVEQIDREARRRQKIFKSALKADQGPFLAMLGRYREEVHAIGPPEDEDDREHSDHVSAIKSSLEEWLKMAQAVKVTTNKDLQLIISGLVFDAIESGIEAQVNIGSTVASFVQWDLLVRGEGLAEKSKGMDPHMKAMLSLLKRSSDYQELLGITVPLLQAIAVIAKQADTALTSAVVETLLPAMREPALLGMGMPIVQNISQSQPGVLAKHMDLLLDVAKAQPGFATPLFGMLGSVAEADQTQIERVMATLEAAVDFFVHSSRPEGAIGALMAMRRVGLLRPETLAKRKAKVERWKDDPVLQAIATQLLDVIANARQ